MGQCASTSRGPAPGEDGARAKQGTGYCMAHLFKNLRNHRGFELEAPPARQKLIKTLQTDEFDILVIGGGATGLGAALEATRRGLKVALVEKYDFAAGTSSRSTNMLHGGVRYLATALREGKDSQMKLVKKGLLQENYIFQSAPFMVNAVPIMVPCYTDGDKEKFGELLKKYDSLTEDNPFPEAYYATRKELLFQFPNVNDDKLVGAWVYYDGQQNDARMALLLALTAVEQGACVVNHCGVESLVKNDGKVRGANVKDELTGNSFRVNAKVVINATGCFSDSIRKMDDPSSQDVIVPAAGTHVVLPGRFSPDRMGMVIMETSDERVLFYLPWQGKTLVGTTDKLVEVTAMPSPSDEEIDWIIREINRYLSADSQATRDDILSAWSGIRPLARGTQSLTGTSEAKSEDKNDIDTKAVTREHVVMVSDSELVSIAGGKWTTYMAMAKDVINRAMDTVGLQQVNPDVSRDDYGSGAELGLVGSDRTGKCCSQKFNRNVVDLVEKYKLPRGIAKHLSESYGTRALHVAELEATRVRYAKQYQNQPWELLHPSHKFLVGEVYYSIHFEYAASIVDILSRRTRLAQMDVEAAAEVVEKVCVIMAAELGWGRDRIASELDYTRRFLLSMGLRDHESIQGSAVLTRTGSSNFADLLFDELDENKDGAVTRDEMHNIQAIFDSIDINKDGSISAEEVRLWMHKLGSPVSDEQAQHIVSLYDTKDTKSINVQEFQQWYGSAKKLSTRAVTMTSLKDQLPRPTIYAHRGACGYRPEHVLPGYEHAVHTGADYIEFDVVSTKDGHLIIVHDLLLDRVSDVAQVFPKESHPDKFTKHHISSAMDGDSIDLEGYFAANFTLEEIKKLRNEEQWPFRVGVKEDGLYQISTVSEAAVFLEKLRKECGRNFGLVIELKRPKWHEEIGLPLQTRLMDDIEKSGFQGPICIQCFEPEPLKQIKSQKPDWTYMRLVIDRDTCKEAGIDENIGVPIDEKELEAFVDDVATYADIIAPWKGCIVSDFHDPPSRSPLIDLSHERGLEVVLYTFRSDVQFLNQAFSGNAALEYIYFWRLGCDGVFTDFPSHAYHARKLYLSKTRSFRQWQIDVPDEMDFDVPQPASLVAERHLLQAVSADMLRKARE